LTEQDFSHRHLNHKRKCNTMSKIKTTYNKLIIWQTEGCVNMLTMELENQFAEEPQYSLWKRTQQ